MVSSTLGPGMWSLRTNYWNSTHTQDINDKPLEEMNFDSRESIVDIEMNLLIPAPRLMQRMSYNFQKIQINQT